MKEKRIYLLVLCIVGALLLGFGKTSQTAYAVGDQTLKVGVMKGTQFFPIKAMQGRGLEKKYSLDMQIIPMASPSAIHIAISGHQVDVAFSTWQSHAMRRSKGGDPLLIMPVNYYVAGIIVKKDSSVKSLKDLVGKKLGTISGPGYGASLVLQYAAEREFGLDLYKQIENREAATPLLLAMLEKGELDAVYLSSEPQMAKSLAGGKYKRIWEVEENFKKLGKAIPLQLSVITTDQVMNTKKEALKKFIAAYTEAKNILTTEDQIWPELGKLVELNSDKELEMLKKSLIPKYVQTWNKSFTDNELELNYEMAALQKGVKVIPDKIPEGFFSFDLYKR